MTDEAQGTDGKRPPVSIIEAAALLGVTRHTVYRWVERGDFRAVRVGRGLKIRRIDIDRHIERQERLLDRYVS